MAARKKRRRSPQPSDLIRPEIEGLACDYFCHEGMTAPKIQEQLRDEHGVKVTREQVYRFVRKAAVAGWVEYKPPQEYSLHRRIKEQRYPWLRDVSVVQTARCEDVAFRGARMLLELIQQDYAGKIVHIGFSGGFGLRTLARRFAQLLREPTERLPEEIVFHAMVAGFDVTDPTTDPNAFFTYFVQDPPMQVNTSFVAFHAPAMARPELLAELTRQAGIKEAYERAHEIDVIVTGASCWHDDHSALRRYLELAEQPIDDLEGAGCIGDILWQPIARDGPIEMKTAIRAMTVKQLDELSEFVAGQGHVLLVSGPCSKCHLPKTEVVKAILDQKRQLITHLAVDSRCGRDLLAM